MGLIFADFAALGVIRENKSQWKFEKVSSAKFFKIECQKMSKDHFLHVYSHQRSANNAYSTNKDAYFGIKIAKIAQYRKIIISQ